MTSEKARAIAALMSRAFQVAYKDWKGDREKQARQRKRKKNALKGPDGLIDDCLKTGSSGVDSSVVHTPMEKVADNTKRELKVSNI